MPVVPLAVPLPFPNLAICVTPCPNHKATIMERPLFNVVRQLLVYTWEGVDLTLIYGVLMQPICYMSVPCCCIGLLGYVVSM